MIQYKKLNLTKTDLQNLQHSQWVMIQSLFKKGYRPLCRIVSNLEDFRLTAKTEIRFLDEMYKESRIECHAVITPCSQHSPWQTVLAQLQSGDVLNFIWFPDVLVSPAMLQAQQYGDILYIQIIRKFDIICTQPLLYQITNDPHKRLVFLQNRPKLEHLIQPAN